MMNQIDEARIRRIERLVTWVMFFSIISAVCSFGISIGNRPIVKTTVTTSCTPNPFESMP